MKLTDFFQKQQEEERRRRQTSATAGSTRRSSANLSSLGIDLHPVSDSGFSALTSESDYYTLASEGGEEEEEEEDEGEENTNKRGWFSRCKRKGSNENDEEATATGSSVLGATFNLTNGIVGAGVIGLGGAMAVSGGLISVFFIVFFAILTKFSLDLLIDLTIRHSSNGVGSYEELGKAAYGTFGRLAVLTSKMLYSFGGLVAFVVIVKDNFGSGLRSLIYGNESDIADSSSSTSGFESFLQKDYLLVIILVSTVILPLSLLRDMTPLAVFSIFSVLAFVAIVVIVVVLFFTNPGGEVRMEGGSVYENWFVVRSDIFESLGTFVLLYVCQNFCHLTYESLDPKIRNIKTWKKVSTYSLSLSGVVSLIAGLFVYMTFWQQTKCDIFDMYPPSIAAIDVAKILLCLTMLFTFPLPFFTCREIAVLVALDCFHGCGKKKEEQPLEEVEFGREDEGDAAGQLRAPLLEEGNEWGVNGGLNGPKRGTSKGEGGSGMFEDILDPGNNSEDEAELSRQRQRQPRWLIQGEDRQLTTVYHFSITFILLSIVTILAIIAPNLGDVLDLVGCAMGSVIGFILPALFSFKLDGYSHLSMVMLIVGALVGLIGTWFSMKKLIIDASV